KRNWQWMSVSICKQHFSAKDPGPFELENVEAADVGEELDLFAMAEQGNDSCATFEQAYAGSTTLNMNTLLHRHHRPSNANLPHVIPTCLSTRLKCIVPLTIHGLHPKNSMP